MKDKLFNFTTALLHFNTGLTDVKGNTFTSAGGTSISATSRYGAGSLSFTGSASGLHCASVAGFLFGTGDFTIELSVKTTDATLHALVDMNGFNVYSVSLKADGTPQITIGGLTHNGVTVINDGNWHDLCFQRSGATVYIHVDGVLTFTGTNAADMGLNGNSLSIGCSSFTTLNYVGLMDELRITKGRARYGASNYTPTGPFPDGLQEIDMLRKRTQMQKNLPAVKRAASLRYTGL